MGKQEFLSFDQPIDIIFLKSNEKFDTSISSILFGNSRTKPTAIVMPNKSERRIDQAFDNSFILFNTCLSFPEFHTISIRKRIPRSNESIIKGYYMISYLVKEEDRNSNCGITINDRTGICEIGRTDLADAHSFSDNPVKQTQGTLTIPNVRITLGEKRQFGLPPTMIFNLTRETIQRPEWCILYPLLESLILLILIHLLPLTTMRITYVTTMLTIFSLFLERATPRLTFTPEGIKSPFSTSYVHNREELLSWIHVRKHRLFRNTSAICKRKNEMTKKKKPFQGSNK